MLIVTISRTRKHFSLVDARSRSQLHMAGAFITFSDCLVLFISMVQTLDPLALGHFISMGLLGHVTCQISSNRV